MTLVELHVDVARVADALEKIVFLLEKLVFPPPAAEIKVQQATLDDLHTMSEEDHTRMQAEQQEFAERFRVVPGSPAMMRALVDWEEEERSIHGKEWQPPASWKTVLAAVERGGTGRAPEAAAASAARPAGEAREAGARQP